jgi:tripartite-type tricarboxylate transporter receptor subunit TctC
MRINSISARHLLLAIATLGLGLAAAVPAASETYPSRPITMIVPLAPGGSTDVIARILADGMQTALGQPIIVENTSGAGGSLGIGRLSRAVPDGYTIGIGQWGTNVANGVTYQLGYDLVTDLEPIGLISTQPFLLDASSSVPATDLKGLVAWLKANAHKVSEGNSGVGTPSYFAGMLFQNAIGERFQMIPYRSAAQSMQGLMAGDIDILFDTPAISMSQIRAGTIRSFAVTAPNRLSIAPDIPTTDEAGLPGFYFSFWHGFWAPKGTPTEIVTKLNEAVMKSLADPVIRKKLTDLAQEIFPPDQQTPEALAAHQKAEIEKWWPIIKAINGTAERDG